MNYITTIQAAEKWHITPRRITNLIKDGRIEGAIQVGYHWLIPENAQKPLDKRTKDAKKEIKQNNTFIRYPLFEGRPLNSFNPPLSAIEIKLKEMKEAIFACEFERAKELLNETLKEKNIDKYSYIYLLYGACYVYIYCNDFKEFNNYYHLLTKEFKEDFPRKKEYLSLVYEIDSTIGLDARLRRGLVIDPEYSYHSSFLPHLASLSIIVLVLSKRETLTLNEFIPYEVICSFYDDKDYYNESETMHLYLGILYGLNQKPKESEYHLKKALDYAYKYHFYYQIADIFFYFSNFLEPLLIEYPETFVTKIQSLSNQFHERYTKFIQSTNKENIFTILNSKDYQFVYYALLGYTNKEIGAITNLSQSNVGNKYSQIYETISVKNKAGLIKYYNDSINGKT